DSDARPHARTLCAAGLRPVSVQRGSHLVEPESRTADGVEGCVLVLVGATGEIGRAAGAVSVRMGAAGPRREGEFCGGGDAATGSAAGGSYGIMTGSGPVARVFQMGKATLVNFRDPGQAS